MTPNQAAYLGLVLAVVLSNLPFVGGRRGERSLSAARIVSWLVLYGAWIAATVILEKSVGAQVPQDWSIWPVSIAFFAVLAFPGIVYRYLWRS